MANPPPHTAAHLHVYTGTGSILMLDLVIAIHSHFDIFRCTLKHGMDDL